jgi:hypothetical protein
MDPLSVAGLAIAVGQVVGAICTIPQQIKEAKGDIRLLCDQLFAFKGLLEHIEAQRTALQDGDNSTSENGGGITALLNSADFSKMMESSQDLLNHLIHAVSMPQGFLRRALHIGKWPIAKNEIQGSIAKLESIKGWFLLAMMTDELQVVSTLR